MLIVLFSIADTITNVIVLLHFWHEPQLEIFAYLSLIVFVANNVFQYLSLFYLYNASRWPTILAVFMLFWVASFFPIFYLTVEYAINHNHDNKKLHDFLWHFFGLAINKRNTKHYANIQKNFINMLNKHAGFLLQIVFESIPNMIIQSIALLILTYNKTENENGNEHFHYNYHYWISLSIVSISIAIISWIIRLFLMTYIYQNAICIKVYIWKYCLIICDLFCVITSILWIICDNIDLYHDWVANADYSCSDGTFNSIFINHMKYWYHKVWIYNLLMGVGSVIVPTLCFAVFTSGYFLAFVYGRQHVLLYNKILKGLILVLLFPCVMSTSAMIGVYIIVYCLLISQIVSLTWIVHCISVSVEKKIESWSKLGFLFWRFILTQFLGKQRKNDTRIGVIAINYSFCRYHIQSKNDNINNIKYGIVQSDHSSYTQLFEYLDCCIKEKNMRSLKTKQKSVVVAPKYNDNCKGNKINGVNSIGNLNDQDNDGIITSEHKQKIIDQLIENPLKDVTYSSLRNVKFSHQDVKNTNFDTEKTFWNGVFSNLFGKDEALPAVFSIIGFVLQGVYFVTRIYFIIFPFILIINEIVFIFSTKNWNAYLLNHVYDSPSSIAKHLFLMVSLIMYCITIGLFAIEIYRFYWIIWHIMPNKSSLPSVITMNEFAFFICDIHATYDALVFASLREHYICQIFGKDLGGIILLYTASTKNIEKLIDSNNAMLQFFEKTEHCSIQPLHYNYNHSYNHNSSVRSQLNLAMIEMDESKYNYLGNDSSVTGISKSQTIINGINIKCSYSSHYNLEFMSYRGNFNLSFGYKWYYEIRVPLNNEMGRSQFGFGTNLCYTNGVGRIGEDRDSWAYDTWHQSGLHDEKLCALFLKGSRWFAYIPCKNSPKCMVITVVFDCTVRECCKMEGYINGVPLSCSDTIGIYSSGSEQDCKDSSVVSGVIFDNIDLSDERIRFIYPCLSLDNNQQICVVFDQQSMEFPKSITNGYRAINVGLLF